MKGTDEEVPLRRAGDVEPVARMVQEPEVASVDLNDLLGSTYGVMVMVAERPCAITTTGNGPLPAGR